MSDIGTTGGDAGTTWTAGGDDRMPRSAGRGGAEGPVRSPAHRAAALDWLEENARHRELAGLRRRIIPRRPDEDPAHVDLASNDYLGLGRHPDVKAGAIDAVETWGAGSTGSRLVTGSTTAHAELEDDLADFLGHEAALVFSSGYAANLGAVCALASRGTLVVSDGGSHASLVDACRLSRARIVVTDRGDVAQVRAALAERTEERAVCVTDSVYSIDGKLAPVEQLYEVAVDNGAVLIADEAHGLGVRGTGGRGYVEELGLSGREDLVVTATLSKALGAQGGAVLGSRRVVDHLVDSARTFIFDTGLAPAAVGAARTALDLLRRDPELPARVRERAARIAEAAGAEAPDSSVISIVVGDPELAVAARDALAERGIGVGCFRPPSVPVGTSRLRLSARADLTDADLERTVEALGEVLPDSLEGGGRP